MLRYIGKRILIAIPTFLGITVLVYVLSSMAPGTPLEMIFNDPNATAEQMAAMKAKLGLDQPVMIQYFNLAGTAPAWKYGCILPNRTRRLGRYLRAYRTDTAPYHVLSGVLHPDRNSSGNHVRIQALYSLGLHFLCVFLYRSSHPKLLCRTGICISPFCSIEDLPKWRYVRYIRCQNPSDAVTSPIPSNAGPFHPAGRNLIRQTRGAMLDVLQEDYIRTARAKGALEGRVLFKHALQNAFIPIITRIGMMIPFLVGGAVVTEQIFAWPGLGSLMVLSINSRDYPVIMGITVFIAAAVLIGNMIVDLVYGLLDPKIRYS